MEEQLNAFLLTRDWQDRKIAEPFQQLSLAFWVTSDRGPVHIRMEPQEAVLFVEASDIERARQILTSSISYPRSDDYPRGVWHDKPVELNSFQWHKVFALYFREQRALYRARDLLKANNITAYETDINPADRFLMERFVTGSLQIYGELQQCEGHLETINPKIKSAPYSPSFKVMSLDIETSMVGEHLYAIGLVVCHSGAADLRLPTQEQRVFMVGDTVERTDQQNYQQIYQQNYLIYCCDETALLKQFLHYFNEIDPDIIIGWSVVNFDLRFLQRKADALHIPLTLGRANQSLDWRQNQDNEDHYTLKIPGRLVLDGIDTLKSATYNFESFSLQYVSSALLKRGKLIHDVDNRGTEITRLFNEDKPALAAYNLEDCQLVWDIFTHAQLIDFAVERAQLTGLAMDRFGGSVASFDNRYLPRLHRAGFVAPNIPDNPQAIGSPGGYVMDSFPGIYDHVLVLDFKSLYPSIIRTFKIDPMGLIMGNKVLNVAPVRNQKETVIEGNVDLVPGYNGAVFSKTQNILPDIIRELWQARDEAKRQKNAALSQAIKILMNSFYGVLGTPGCRFFDSRLPSSITLRGHDILTRSKQFIEAKGFQVIYGDTDSIFVWLKELPKMTAQTTSQATSQADSQADSQTIGATLARELNAWWTEYLQATYQLTSYLEIQFETHFVRFIMPTIRGSEIGSKKRYAGLVYNKLQPEHSQQGHELIFKGLETVRTDWTPLAREFQRELYRRIFFNEPYEEFIRQTIADITQGKCDAQLIYRKRIRRNLDEYQRNVPPHVQAASKAEFYFQQQGLASRYRRGGWIQYVMTTQGPEPLEHHPSQLDYEHYIERQLEPIVDGILHFYNVSYKSIMDNQIGLFD